MKFKFPKIDSKAIGRTFDIIGKFGKEHLPAILTICGIIGVTGSIVLTADAVKKSEEDINKAEFEANEGNSCDEFVRMPRKEKIKLCWKHYIPGGVLYLVSIGLIIGGQKVSLGRLAAITGLLQLRTKDFEELKKKIIEKDGKEKFEEYKKAVEQDKINAADFNNILNTGHGSTIFYDPMSGHLFLSDIWHVETAVRMLTSALFEREGPRYFELSEFYKALDFPIKPECGRYFAFYDYRNEDLDALHPERLFSYNAINSNNGDNRACIYLDYMDRLDPSHSWDEELDEFYATKSENACNRSYYREVLNGNYTKNKKVKA